MSMILSSKTIDTTGKGYAEIIDGLTDWLYTLKLGELDGHITVIAEVSENRQRKITVKKKLQELIEENSNIRAAWYSSGYRFNFLLGEYAWKGEDIHVTAGEALFLFRWLVLTDDINRLQWFYLRNMRRRLGQDFLREVTR